MRISIWQQFSSNHSGSFTVVGVFESADDAQLAAEELQNIVKKITSWHKQHPEEWQIAYKKSGTHDMLPFPPEIELGRQYGVEWEKAVDWYAVEEPSELVTVLDRAVIFSPIYNTWRSPKPISAIMSKLGGQVISEFFTGSGVYMAKIAVSLTCLASDENSATTLFETMGDYLRDRRGKRAPWDKTGEYDMSAEGKSYRTGNRLTFDIHFFTVEKGLLAFINHLKSQGCTHIEYAFIQLPYED